MTIEAGVLAMRIQEQGAEEVAKKLDALDKKATKLGSTPVSLPVKAPSQQDLTLIDRQLEQLGKQVTLYKQGSTFAGTRAGSLRELGEVEKQLHSITTGTNTSLEQRIVAERQLAQIAAGAPAKAESMIASLGKLALGYFTVQTAMRAVGAAVGLVTDSINLGDTLHDLSIRTGVSVETLSTLIPVADKSGSSLEGLANGFKFLNRTTDEARQGSAKAVRAFQDIGISVEQLKGKSPEQVLGMVATALINIDDPARRVDDAMKILGRSGESLLPTMVELANGGFERAREKAELLGGVMSTTFSNNADAFNDDVRDMSTAMHGLGRAVAEVVIGPITGLLEGLTRLIVIVRELFSIDDTRFLHFLSIAGNFFTGNYGAAAAGLIGDKILFSGLVSGGSSTAGPKKKPQPPRAVTAEEIAEAKRAAEERQKVIDKALGIDLGNIPIGLTNTDPLNAPGFFPTVGTDSKGMMKKVKAFGIADIVLGSDAKIKEQMEAKKAFINSLWTDVAGSIGGALGDAFTAAFSGDDNFFAALGKGLLRSLGNMIMQLGESMVEYALLTQVLSVVPGPWQALGWGALATGAAGLGLIALGAGMGAIGGKGGKGSHGGGGGGGGRTAQGKDDNAFEVAFDPDHKLRKRSGPAVIPSVRGIDNSPIPQGGGTVNIGVINTLHPDNAEWQRVVSKTVTNARARGLKAG